MEIKCYNLALIWCDETVLVYQSSIALSEQEWNDIRTVLRSRIDYFDHWDGPCDELEYKAYEDGQYALLEYLYPSLQRLSVAEINIGY